MLATLFSLLPYLLASLLLSSCHSQLSPSFAITHATVIDATGAPPQPDTTVIITNQRITAVGPSASIAIPRGAKVLDAIGKFLIPGLVDSHVHLTAAGEPTGSRNFIIPLLVANGITTVRDMGGKVEYLTRLRSEINVAHFLLPPRLGPQIFFAGPYLDGDPSRFQPSIAIKGAADARSAVDLLVSQHVDFVKTQSNLGRDAYFAIAAESKAKGIRFVGHVPDRISALEASNAGQASIEHFTGILLACSTKEDELRQEQFQPNPSDVPPNPTAVRSRSWQRRLLDSYSPQKADALIHAFVRNNTWQVPTFPVLVHLAFITPQTNLAGDARMNYIPQNERTIWQTSVHDQLDHRMPTDLATRQEIIGRYLALVGAMQKAGVRFLAGTDTPAPNVFPGSSLHEDLAYLVAAGLTPMQALQAATRDPAEFLNQLDTHGTIEPNKVADLVLLDANPLDDIHNTQKIRAVILRGQLLDRPALDSLLLVVEQFARQGASNAR